MKRQYQAPLTATVAMCAEYNIAAGSSNEVASFDGSQDASADVECLARRAMLSDDDEDEEY